MNLSQTLISTHSNSLKELESKYNFKLEYKQFEGVITEEVGIYSTLKDVKNEISKLCLPKKKELKIKLIGGS